MRFIQVSLPVIGQQVNSKLSALLDHVVIVLQIPFGIQACAHIVQRGFDVSQEPERTVNRELLKQTDLSFG